MNVLRASLMAALVALPGMTGAAGFRLGVGLGVRTTVTPMENGVYEVASQGSSAAITYWCGIGDYAIRTLRTSATQRIYIARPYARESRTVQFSLTPPQGADTKPGYSVSVKRVGDNMSAATAQRYCYDNFNDFGF